VTVVLLHGLGVGQRYFDALAAELEGELVRPELRDPLPIAELAARVEAALLERACVVSTQARAVVVANSMGCQVAVELAIARPDLVAAIVLVGPTVDPAARTMPAQIGRLLSSAWFEPLRLIAIVVRDYFVTGPVATLRQARHALAHRMEERLPRVDVPTVVVRGAHDRLCPDDWARRVVSLLPDARLETVAGAAHAAHFSHAAAVAAVVSRLRGGTPAARA